MQLFERISQTIFATWNCFENEPTMNLKFLDVILIVLFAQLLTLTPYLFFGKSKGRFSNRILGFFLLAKAICVTNFLSFRIYDITLEYIPHLFYFGTSFTILWGPLLYLYVKSLTTRSSAFSTMDIFHFVPFLLYFGWLTISFHVKDANAIREIMNNGGFFSGVMWTNYYQVFYPYTLIYTLLTIPLIRSYHKDAKENFASMNKINLNWMIFIVAGFTVKVLSDIWVFFAEYNTNSWLIGIYVSRVVLFVFINILIFKSLSWPVVFGNEWVESNGRRHHFSNQLKQRYLERLIEVVEHEKLYLNPDITLEKLSGKMDVSPRTLSSLLNESLNQNFYDFINGYRVKESQRIFLSPEESSKTILEVLYEVGFNSKSSFNTAFKKYTKQTPTEFRRTNKKSVG